MVKGYALALCDLSPYDVHDALAELWRDADNRAMPAPGVIRKHVAAKKVAERARLPMPTLGMTDYDTAFGELAFQLMQRVADLNDEYSAEDACREFMKIANELGPKFLGRGGDGAEIRMRESINELGPWS